MDKEQKAQEMILVREHEQAAFEVASREEAEWEKVDSSEEVRNGSLISS